MPEIPNEEIQAARRCVLEAAERWLAELGEYVIPSANSEEDEQTYTAQAEKLRNAIDLLQRTPDAAS